MAEIPSVTALDALVAEQRQCDILLPPFEAPPEDFTQMPEWMLGQFRNLALANGFATDCTPRDDVLIAAHGDGPPYAIVRSQYRGLTDADLEIRRKNFDYYKLASAEIKGTIDNELRQKQQRQIEKNLLTGMEQGGVRGVEDYSLTLTSDNEIAQQAALGKISVSQTSLFVSHTHHLPEERDRYGLPKKLGGFKAFPYNGPAELENAHLWISGKHFSSLPSVRSSCTRFWAQIFAGVATPAASAPDALRV